MTPRNLLYLLILVFHASAFAGIDLRRVVSGLASPVFVTHASDDRLFIVEQPGVIRVYSPVSATTTVFLDIQNAVLDGGERGLLGLAFHPNYASNGRFFVFYTRTGDGALTIAEYHVSATNPNFADPTEIPILTIPHPTNANHNGGMIAFGNDGYLYIATGDGGAGNDPPNNAQNVESLLGKILRINVNGAAPYTSPSNNPFVGRAGRDEIYAWGLRNPWRFSFDAGTGRLILGDVGQGAWEEVDYVTIGGNYGWRVYEGTHCTNIDSALCTGAYEMPVLEYSHSGGRCSITGGYHYHGGRRAVGNSFYVFADYCTGEIFESPNPAFGTFTLLLDTPFFLSSFGRDRRGELYVVDHGGAIYRIVNSSRNDFQGVSITGERGDDLLWRNNQTGVNEVWFMDNTRRVGAETLPAVDDTNWRIRGTADFNGDGNTDILWRNRSTGANAVWFMNATRPGLASHLPGVEDLNWEIAGSNDFNGDGWTDIVWRNGVTGGNALWLMQGLTLVRAMTLPPSPDADWVIVGLDDLSGDGWNDIVWYHQGSGGVAVWVMQATQVTSATALPGEPSLLWRLQGVGDLNRDGKGDLLWRNQNTGENAVWFMNNLAVTGSALLPPMTNPDFQLVAPR